MALIAGNRLGPYEIAAPLGAGGMGEVWKARDTRLGREVAIKVLPAEVASDPSRLKRFEKEARSASALNHPNIVTIYDIGSVESVSYIAMEKVDGKTLRELLFSGPLPVKRLLQAAAQIADGLARAHEAGIVHRDLKPENVMVTKDGLVKILDFGLAKLTQVTSSSDEGSHLPTETGTSPGVVLGTVGYMSPEQASGALVDFRSDQFSFGSILYEMATGKRAFQKGTAVDTLSAILHEDPKPVAQINPEAPAPLRWIVERCLAKDPEDRYGTTKDLARDLATLRDRLSEASVSGATLAAEQQRPRRRSLVVLAVAALLAAAFAGVFFLGRRAGEKPPPVFHRLTFRRGLAGNARFAPDGQTVVYTAKWGDEPKRVFMTRIGNPEALKLPLPDATRLLSVSQKGELALELRGPDLIGSVDPPGTLATVPLAGGAPRELLEKVHVAEWAPDGKSLAVVRDGRLEFPAGKVLYKDGRVICARFSPRGDRIAFVEERGQEQFLSTVDLAGRRIELARGIRAYSLAWSPNGEEIWFATGPLRNMNTIVAVTLSGRLRVLARLTGVVLLQDVSSDGRVLLTTGVYRHEVWCLPAGETKERDVGWLATSDAEALSADGKTILLNDLGEEGGGPGFSAFLRRTDGSPAFKVTDGLAEDLSPDTKWVACIRDGKALLLPTGAGEPRTLASPGFEYQGIEWFPDGRRLLVAGREQGRQKRLYLQDLSGGPPRPLSTEGITGPGRISPDGNLVVADQPDGFWIYPVSGGERRRLPEVRENEYVTCWSEDGRSVFVTIQGRLPYRIDRIDVATGRRELWRTIAPADPTAVQQADVLLKPNGSYALNVQRLLSDLYLVEGLK